VAGGYGNQAAGSFATVGGGAFNKATNSYSTAAGGYLNNAGGFYGTIGGGYRNTASSNATTVAGGYFNSASGPGATVSGGYNNTASGNSAMVCGGTNNTAGGTSSFAAGEGAQALADGTFVWADSQGGTFTSTLEDTVAFRCALGIFITGGPLGGNQSVAWAPGAGSWSFTSDRNLKERFEAVDTQSVLEKVARLPILEWNYKKFPQRHIGAMAQDFHALFPLNDDDKSLNELDLHGVELAAIQGLNDKVEVGNQKSEARMQKLEAENAELKQQNGSLEKRLEALEEIIRSINSNQIHP